MTTYTQYVVQRDDDSYSFDKEEVTIVPCQKDDVLVKVKAISINPIDTKMALKRRENQPRSVLGWDVSGTIVALGENVTDFEVGDDVFYAGAVNRPGGNADYHYVDSRLIARKPANLSHAEAAALPLTSLTAWESLFERLRVAENHKTNPSIMIIGGAGGVGSVAIPLAKAAGLRVIATASRPETEEWVKEKGADVVINHYHSLSQQLAEQQEDLVDYLLCLNHTDQHWEEMSRVIAPQGRICSIVDNQQPLDLSLLKPKSATFSWEFMFTRSTYQTHDMAEQGRILEEIAKRVEQGVLKTTVTEVLNGMNEQNLLKGHQRVASGKMIGKLVIQNESTNE